MKSSVFMRFALLVVWLALSVACLKRDEGTKLTIAGVQPEPKKVEVKSSAQVASIVPSDHNINYYGVKQPEPLDFTVENQTGKTVYVTCFSYLRRRLNARWSWYKSAIYEILHNRNVLVKVPATSYEPDNKSVFGVLGVYNSEQEAQDAVYELMKDDEKIDLDLLYNLKGKKVTLNVEQYGFKKPFYDYDFIALDKKSRGDIPELDFYVFNNSQKTLYVCAFSYMKRAKGSWIAAQDKDDMTVWRYDKSKVLKLAPGDYGYMDIDTISSKYDRDFVIGYLGVFGESEEQLAKDATFELLDQKRKLEIGNLKDFKNGVIVIDIQKYGLLEDVVDFTVKPAKKIDMKKLIT